MTGEWELVYPSRPWTVNGERKGNRWERAAKVREWRQAYSVLARAAGVPKLQHFDVTAVPYQHGGRLQDVAACMPAVKAAIDGIADAGVVPDDSSEFVRSVTFLPPRRGRNALVVIIRGEPKE